MKKILQLGCGLFLAATFSSNAQVTVNSTSGPSLTATYTSVNTALPLSILVIILVLLRWG